MLLVVNPLPGAALIMCGCVIDEKTLRVKGNGRSTSPVDFRAFLALNNNAIWNSEEFL
jgi:hypothetical protein